MHTSLFIGRFQPLHNGHYRFLTELTEKSDCLKIVIGSAQESGTLRNPFNASVREKMLRLLFPDTDKVKIYLLNDYETDEEWVDRLLSLVKEFDKIYIGDNTLVETLLTDKAVVMGRCYADGLSATEIRSHINDSAYWKPRVPKEIHHLLEGKK